MSEQGMKFDENKPAAWLLPYASLKRATHPDFHQGLRFLCDVARGEGYNITFTLSADDLLCATQVLAFGAQKYAAFNWEKGLNFSRVISAGIRHALAAGLDGDGADVETDLAHKYHFDCNILFMVQYLDSMRHNPDTYRNFDDRQKQ